MQHSEIVRGNTVLITREDQRRGAALPRNADAAPKSRCHALRPFVVDADLNRKVGYHAPVLVRITAEQNSDRSDARRQSAATLPSEERLTANRYQLLRGSESP
jgi:hypothetical protein